MTDFPGIHRATLLIALDNGGINRGRSEAQQKQDLDKFLARQPSDILPAIDAWLSSLTDEQLEEVCCGESDDMQAAMKDAPPFTDQLLNDYFDEVC